MIRLRRGTVLELIERRPGAVELLVRVEGDPDPSRAIAYPALTGPVRVGDVALLNTTAGWLGLGTGGVHFVIAVEGVTGLEAEGSGRTMKVRYTPMQVRVMAAEEEASPHRDALEAATTLGGAPVVWVPLHSMIGPAVAGARAAGASRVAYVMTDGAALPAPLSRLTEALRSASLLDSVVTCGHAFGGDLEAVNVFTGLLAAHLVTEADVIVVGDGPGNTGTNTGWGASDIESAMSLNAAAILDGRPVAALRMSFADPRDRHRGLSHHSVTALSLVALAPTHVAVPVLEDEGRRSVIWKALTDAGLDQKHQLVEVTGRPALDLLSERGVEAESMGRGVSDDPEFFLAAGAAGVLAGRMATRDRAWEDGGGEAGPGDGPAEPA
jgi:ribosomal protein S28E/S33